MHTEGEKGAVRVQKEASVHTEGGKGAVRVQKEVPVHTEGEKGAVRVQKEVPVHTEGEKERCVCKRRPQCTPRERVGAGDRVKKEAAESDVTPKSWTV